MQLLKFVLIISLFSSLACVADKSKILQERTKKEPNKLERRISQSKQLLISLGATFSSKTGELYLFERKDKVWTKTWTASKVNYGSNGLAWGMGLYDSKLGIQKKEGDKKSPAGIFEIGTAFGYGEQPKSCKTNYHQIDLYTQCIEDVKSKWYNTIIDKRNIQSDWNSTDLMLRNDDLFKYGFFVEHNSSQIPGKGSCIFFHLWRNENSFTAGCTALSEKDMHKLISELDSSKKPLLIQMPQKEYKEMSKKYSLPSF